MLRGPVRIERKRTNATSQRQTARSEHRRTDGTARLPRAAPCDILHSVPTRSTRNPRTDGAFANVQRVDVSTRYTDDLYHALLTAPWSRLIILSVAGFAAVNTLFAAAYRLIGDGIARARPGSFADAFFFSVQTMATIGYSEMAPRSLAAHLVVTVEAFVGLIGFAVVAGIALARFSRPTARVLFSRVAVVTQRDGAPSFMFRMANERGTSIVEAQAHVVLIRNETTHEGEAVRRFQDVVAN